MKAKRIIFPKEDLISVDSAWVFLSLLKWKILAKSSDSLISLEALLKREKGEVSEFDYRPPFHGAFIVEPFRAIKNIDKWVTRNLNKTTATIENRFTKQTLRVPLKVLKRGLRRPARTDKIDVTDFLDLVIVKDFRGIEHVMKNPLNVKKWRKYVEPRLVKFVISRRFDISSSGTRFLAYYSEIPMVGVDMWSVQGMSDMMQRFYLCGSIAPSIYLQCSSIEQRLEEHG
jgi:hypothetical protein